MSINYKKVNDVPELVELTGTEKFIVNSNGKARQVSAELVGGGAEATVFYYEMAMEGDAVENSGSGLYDENGMEVSVATVFEALENGIVKLKPQGGSYLAQGHMVIDYVRLEENYGMLFMYVEGSLQTLYIGQSTQGPL